jgi:hypothetical protein
MDRNVEAKPDVPMWSETRWNGCWNAAEGVGLYLHMGRLRKDVDLWWAQTVAYLPGERLVVDRCWGRNPNELGVTLGGFDLTCTEDGWTSAFDGGGQVTSYEALLRAPRGDAAPCSPMSWSVTATAVSPVFDPYSGQGGTLDFAGDAHVQQAFSTAGWLKVDGREYALDGIGFKDHSSGVRDWASWKAHRFMLAVMPGFTLHAAGLDAAGDDPDRRTAFGAFYRDGEQLGISRFEMPLLTDRFGLPALVDVVVELSNGERLEIASAELVHALPMTITEENENLNGIDWQSDGNPIVLMEGIGRLTLADGTVGYMYIESSARRDDVAHPEGGN